MANKIFSSSVCWLLEALAFSFLLTTTVYAANDKAFLKLSPIFCDHMVLQQQQPDPVWGDATPGETVEVSFDGKKYQATAGKDGRWMLYLPAMKASAEPKTMTIKSGKFSKTISDILVGEVWLCSGQSNMEWPVRSCEDAKTEIPKANHPTIRFFDVPHGKATLPLNHLDAKWEVCTPESAKKFSGIGYYFARALNNKLNVPVGMIGANWSGTHIDPWITREGLPGLPKVKHYQTFIEMSNKKYQKNKAPKADELISKVEAIKAEPGSPLNARIQSWLLRAKIAKEQGKPLPIVHFGTEADKELKDYNYTWVTGGFSNMFNAMIAPLVPYGIRGFLWYQGENNVGGKETKNNYSDAMKALVRGWRKAWKDENNKTKFYFCQIAPCNYGDKRFLPAMWEAQYIAKNEIPNTAMTSDVDICNSKNIHPQNKKQVAARLARIAFADTYGYNDIKWKNSELKSVKYDGNKAILSFSNAESLKSKDGQPIRHFELAGADGKFYPAEAEIQKNQVIVTSAKISQPKKVRYAWFDTPKTNLVNEADLPVLQFESE